MNEVLGLKHALRGSEYRPWPPLGLVGTPGDLPRRVSLRAVRAEEYRTGGRGCRSGRFRDS